MAYEDLRGYISALEREGELLCIDAEVDWNLEVGAISRRALDLRRQAPLFTRIKGYPKGFSILANPVGGSRPNLHKRLAIALGLGGELGAPALIDEFDRKSDNLVAPLIIENAPCKEMVMRGKDIDLLSFPVPKIHEPDGGRYLGTWHVDVTKDPDTGFVNWGMYRHMVFDQRTLCWLANPAQHGTAHYRRYCQRNEKMPMAIAIGTEPVCSIIAGTQVPAGISEPYVAGGVRGAPVRTVLCETVDLEVPASAEIVIEGYVDPAKRVPEGPFGEFTGYIGHQKQCPVIEVTAVTCRKDPILTMSNMGKPWDDYAVFSSITHSCFVARALREQKIPFKAVYVPAPILAIIVSVNPSYAGFVHTLASAIWASKPGVYRPYIFVVGEDVNVFDMEDVFWCLTTRLHPKEGITVVGRTPAMPLLPYLSPEEQKTLLTPRVLFDATFPVEWPVDAVPGIVDYERAWPLAVRTEVERNWRKYGF